MRADDARNPGAAVALHRLFDEGEDVELLRMLGRVAAVKEERVSRLFLLTPDAVLIPGGGAET